MENRTNRDKSMADFDNNHELNQASSSSRAVNYSSGAANSADKPTAKPAECRTNSLDKIKCRTNRADKPTAKPAEGRTNSADKLECRTNCAEKPTAKPAECRTNSADKQECRTNFPDIATAENCPSNDSNMIWHLGSLCSQRPSEVEMRARNLASSYQNVQNLVLQRRLSFDLQRMEMNSLSIPELRRCLSGPSRQSGLSTDAMPPLPNNSVESSPRPQIAIESLPKQRSSVPATSNNNNNNSSTNLLNNSSTNLLNNSNMLTTFETSVTEPATGHYSGSVQYANHNGHFDDTIQYANHNGFSDHGSTSNGVHEAIDTSNFNREIERLKTFEGWRVPFLSSAQMAAAGFYYTKKDDIVRCAFCGVEVGSWVEGDNPMLDHQRWSPACRFMRKLPVGNVPLTAGDLTAAGLSRTSSEGYDTCGSTTRQYGIVLRQSASAGCGGGSSGSPLNNMRAIEELGIQQMRPPAYPAYSSFESRLASYAMWPISLKLKPNVLSEAGFYYTGKGDQTICYYCGGGLKDWEESDVPWEEHGKWFSRCNFVLSIKGKEFVDKVCNKKPEQDETGVRSETTVSDLEAESSEPRNESEASTLATTSTLSSATEQSTASVSATENGTTSSAANSVESAANPAATADSRLCKICYMEEMGILFLPCGHIVACPKCALLLTTCAVCRKPYSATVRAFLS